MTSRNSLRYARRSFFVAFVTLGLAILVATLSGGNGSVANAAVAKNYVQGTGPTIATPANDLSADHGWKADLAPVAGTATMDESVASGTALLASIMTQQIVAGDTIESDGFSLGALVVGDTIEDLAQQGTDLSNVDVLLSSDARNPHTGALVMLDTLGLGSFTDTFGITPSGPRTTYGNARVVSESWEFDMISDMKNPFRDPWGATNSVVGYFTHHGGQDPLQNYSAASKAAAEKTYYVDELGVTHVTYHGKLPVVRAVEMWTGSPIDPTVERVMNAFVLSQGDPGQEQTYKSIPEAIAEAVGIDLPAPTQAPAEVTISDPALVAEQPMQAAIDTGVQMVQDIAPTQVADQVETWVDQGVQAVEDFANGGWTDAAPATYNEPSYSAPAASAPAYDAPVQQFQQVASDFVTDVAPQAAPIVNNLIAQGAALFGGV